MKLNKIVENRKHLIGVMEFRHEFLNIFVYDI